MTFATLDIAITALILLSALIGLVRGLVKEVLSLVSWGVAFIVAIFFSAEVGALLPETWGSMALRQAIGFVALFIGVLIGAGILQWLIGQLVESTGLSGTDRLLGFLFGSARGLLIALVGLVALEQIASEATWWQEAQLPNEILAFEDEVRELFGQATTFVEEDIIDRERSI